MIRCSAFLLALAALVAPAPAQRTYTVCWAGTADFKSLTEALAAVSPGDTLIVCGYRNEDVSTSKGVRIVGEVGAAGPLAGVLTVHDLPEDQTFSLVNFGGPAFPGKNFRLALKDNRGKVHVDGIRLSRLDQPPWVQIERCAHVSFNESNFWDFTISDSKVLITDSIIVGIKGDQSNEPHSAIVVSGSELTLVDCCVIGGFGPYRTMNPPPPGIAMDRGSLLATGTTQSCIQGAQTYDLSGLPVVGPAIRSDNGSVVLHPDVPLNGIFPGLPHTTGTSRFQKRRVPFMEVHRVPPGSTQFPLLPARLFADAQSLGGIFASLPGKPLSLSLSLGELWLDPATSIYVGAGVLPSGTDPMIEIGIPVPAAVPIGSTFTFQSLVLNAGQAILSTPVEVVLGGRPTHP